MIVGFLFRVKYVMDDKQQEIIDELRRVAKLLNVNSLAQSEFRKYSKFSVSTIDNRFGSWNRAIEAAGLRPNASGISDSLKQPKLTDEELLQELIRLTVELGKQPTTSEMNAFGHFSEDPYRRRWGSLREAVKIAYAKYGVPSGVSVATESLPKRVNWVNKKVKPATDESAQIGFRKTYASSKKTQYGERMDFRGLRHAPLNEQGVVYMFGMVSRELGFLIEAVRTGYPDCLGKRLVNKNPQRWEDVKIEFEFKSSNFFEHGHNPEECDLVVCWIHDWVDCSLEVLELKSAIEYLPNA